MGNTYPVHLCVEECPKGAECPFWAAEHDRMRSRDALYPPKGDWYDIPYRCLLSVDVPNLLASGRCISATHEGMAGARVMATCVAIGQAAGTAAAIAAAQGISPADVDVAQLQDALSADGQLIWIRWVTRPTVLPNPRNTLDNPCVAMQNAHACTHEGSILVFGR